MFEQQFGVKAYALKAADLAGKRIERTHWRAARYQRGEGQFDLVRSRQPDANARVTNDFACRIR